MYVSVVVKLTFYTLLFTVCFLMHACHCNTTVCCGMSYKLINKHYDNDLGFDTIFEITSHVSFPIHVYPVLLRYGSLERFQIAEGPDMEGISAEHLQFSHPCLPALLAKLF